VARAIHSAAFALPLGDAGGLRRRRGRILAHPLITHAGEKEDLRAVIIGSRTTRRLRRLEADEVAHGSTQIRESIVPVDPHFEERRLISGQCGAELNARLADEEHNRRGEKPERHEERSAINCQNGFQVARWVNFR
jgi:hypothetical protein